MGCWSRVLPEEVRCCEAHGFFVGGTCPDCDAAGRPAVSGERRRRLSKFMSGALRHFPADAGIQLDDAGWTTVDSLVTAVSTKYEWADRAAVEAVVATDPKGWFERAGERGDEPNPTVTADRVRAAYGHSVAVVLETGGHSVPPRLYHGTAPRNRESILAEGVRPMGRQQVHLSETVQAAREVGRRHADEPIVFDVDAAGLQAAGHPVRRRGQGVYTTDRVPPAYVAERQESQL